MKSLETRIRKFARNSGVGQLVIERDYAQSYVLLGIAGRPALRESLVFKGGTALRKVHLPGYRFSEDLDFSSMDSPRGESLLREVRAAVDAGQAAARAHAPVSMEVRRVREVAPHPGGQDAFSVRTQFPWQRAPMVTVKIEVTHDEPVLLPAPPRPILHGYGERLGAVVRTYGLEEIAAEKLRATLQSRARLAERGWVRPRARDYYDLWHMVLLGERRVNWSRTAKILPRKCALRNVAFEAVEDAFDPALLEQVRAGWSRTLGPFVEELPDVERVLAETRARLEVLLRRARRRTRG